MEGKSDDISDMVFLSSITAKKMAKVFRPQATNSSSSSFSVAA